MTLRIGWIGCGRHASEMLLPQLLRFDVELVALCDIDPGRLARTARRIGVQQCYADALALISEANIDALGMAVGPDEHLEFGLAAMQRGLPVFMEKPPSATAAGAKALRAASEKAGKPILLGFMKRYSIGNRQASNIIASGDFGQVMGLTGYYMTAPGYFTGEVDYTAFFLHHCIHYMDLVSWFVSPVTQLSARKVQGAPGRLLFHVAFEFESGAIGTIAMGTMQSRGAPVERIDIMSDHQRIEVDNVTEVRWHRDPAFKVSHLDARLDNTVDTLAWRPNFTAAANEDVKGYHAMLSDVISAFRGEDNTAPTMHEGVIAMEWLEALRRELAL